MSNEEQEPLCLGEPCTCEVENTKPTVRRKELVSLTYTTIGEDDDSSEEMTVWEYCLRGGDLEIFYQDNPEHVLIEQETRREEIETAKEVCRRILDGLTDNQCTVFLYRLEGKSFGEIAEATGRCERAIFYDWKVIREVAYSCIPG